MTSPMRRPKGFTSVMSSRVEPLDSLDLFCTPPWATRALCECVLNTNGLKRSSCWEPAAGEGHMSEVLKEYFGSVYASDVHDYGHGHAIGSFVGVGADRAEWPDPSFPPSWVMANPPFRLAVEFAERALDEASQGVALLLRSVWIESADRYERLFRDRAPDCVAFFSERVAMVKGRWDPDASTATSYAWFVWQLPREGEGTLLHWIPPGQRKALEKPDDRKRFAATKDIA